MTSPIQQALLFKYAAPGSALPYSMPSGAGKLATYIADGFSFFVDGVSVNDASGTSRVKKFSVENIYQTTATYPDDLYSWPWQVNTSEVKSYGSSPAPSGGHYMLCMNFSAAVVVFKIVLPTLFTAKKWGWWLAAYSDTDIDVTINYDSGTPANYVYTASSGSGSVAKHLHDEAQYVPTLPGGATKIVSMEIRIPSDAVNGGWVAFDDLTWYA